MIRTLIIDDEAHIRDTLARLVESCCSQVSVIGMASGVANGINAIQCLHPDLVLLDINMEDGTGFDLLNALPNIDFKVIFISDFDQFTIQAFMLSGLEYVIKPVDLIDIKDALLNVMNTELKYFALQFEALELNLRSDRHQF